MTELIIPIIVFSGWTLFSILFIFLHKRHQTRGESNKRSFWNNTYVFDNIPSVFPTLGIFCTALGITIGIWGFNTDDIQSSIPQLLKGLKLAFVATMAGIFGLIIFQKINAVIQKRIDDDPNRPRKTTDELSAINELTFAVEELKKDNQAQIAKLIHSVREDLENKVSSQIQILTKEIITFQQLGSSGQKEIAEGLGQINISSNNSRIELTKQLADLREEQKATSEKANKNTDEIIRAMGENNKLTAKKFDEFSELLRKNNTEALVVVMKSATEQFNQQMSELINRLVQENFAELNNSVKSLNDWQRQNKEQIEVLTEQFQKTTETFSISAETLKDVAGNTKSLVSDEGKLGQIVQELKRVMIEDGKFQDITNKLVNTIQTLESTTESFDETTSKLNDWVKTERNFKESAQILITKLEEFRDFNGDVWDKYRKEMSKAVATIKETSTRLSGDLETINAEFYERLSNTLQNLDECIQRFLPNNRRV